MTQYEFAKAAGVEPLSVSLWEKKGGPEPSAQACIRLAKLAQEHRRFDTALFFWYQAGVDVTALRQLIPEIDKAVSRYEERLFEPPAPGSIVSLPLLGDDFFRGDTDAFRERLLSLATGMAGHVASYVTFPSALVPRPRATFAVRAPNDFMRYIFRKGDVVAIETPPPDFLLNTMKHREYKPVVATYYSRRDPTSENPEEGLRLGRLSRHGAWERPLFALETEMGRQFRMMRALFPHENIKDLDHRDEADSRDFSFSADSSEWSILGIAIAWIGSDRDVNIWREQK